MFPATAASPPKLTSPSCPVCGKTFVALATNSDINEHIDKCLQSGGNSPPDKATQSNSTLRQISRRDTISFRKDDPNQEPWTEWFDLSKQEWYYGAIDRKEAEEILRKYDQDSFLVRKSSVKDSFAISLYRPNLNKLTHSLIVPRNGGYAFENSSNVYKSVLDLIQNSPECKVRESLFFFFLFRLYRADQFVLSFFFF